MLPADPDLSVRATPRRRWRGGIVPRAAFGERGLLPSYRAFDERATANRY